MQENIEIRDIRNGHWFWMENEALNIARMAGPRAFTIYAALCVFASKENKTFISQKKIAEYLGISRRTVVNGIKRLTHLGVVEVIEKNGICEYVLKRLTGGVKNFSQGCEKSFTGGVKKISQGCEKNFTHINNNIINTYNNNKESELRNNSPSGKRPSKKKKVYICDPKCKRSNHWVFYFAQQHEKILKEKYMILQKDFKLAESAHRVYGCEKLERFIDRFWRHIEKFNCDYDYDKNTPWFVNRPTFGAFFKAIPDIIAEINGEE